MGEPRIVADLPDDAYHADRDTLSSSGARKLLDPSCPALFRWEQDNPQPSKAVFDFGKVAHTTALGEGPALCVIDLPDWRAAAAKACRQEAYDSGKVPVLRHEYEAIQAMAAALREHPRAAQLLDLDEGAAELSLYWTDPTSGVACRARPDYLGRLPSGRFCAVDYKTTSDPSPEAFAKSVANFGYHQQDPFYRAAIQGVGLDDNPAFVFIAQAKTPPYLVETHQLDDEFLAVGRDRNRRALDIYARCVAENHWPTWGDGEITTLHAPRWLAA